MGTGTIGLQSIAQVAAARLVDTLIQGVALTVLAVLLLAFFRRHGSRVRFAIWFAVLIVMLAAPLVPLLCSGRAASSSVHPALTLPASWGVYVFGVWSVFATTGLARVGAGLWRIRRLRATCVPVELQSLPAQVQETLARFGGHRDIGVCTSEAIDSPAALGFLRPAVVIPTSLMNELSAEDLNHILLHELAHIRRHDDWSNLVQKLAAALLFFHPAVWWIERRIALEREMACDEAVLAATANPRAYAKCLAFLAERSYLRRSLRFAQAVVGRMRQTTVRVAKILGGGGAAVPGWSAVVPLVLVLGASVVVIARMPEVIAFKDPGTHMAALGARPSAVGPQITLTSRSAPVFLAKSRRPAAESPVSLAESRLTALTSAKTARAHQPDTHGDVILVVFDEVQPLPGSAAWQVQVWQVTLIRQMNRVEGAPRKTI